MKPVVVRFVVVFVLASLLAGGLSAVVIAAQPVTAPPRAPAAVAGYNANPPTTLVKLIFIHHSTGENWLNDGNGQLGIALSNANYFVSDTNYGWGPTDQDTTPGTIGDHTDIPNWYSWFTGPHRDTYLTALYTETEQHSSYSRPSIGPGGENTIIMFKSCFPNSNLDGNPNDPPAASADMNSLLDVAHAKRIYLDALNYFAAHQDKLFIVITAPPLATGASDATRAANARAFNNWLMTSWLSGYAYHNVAVFDFYNVLTSNGGDPDTNDLNSTAGNHHRFRNNVIEHITNQGGNTSAYPTSDSHPSPAGNLKATGEFVPLLNIAWHCWQGDGACPGAAPLPDLSGSQLLVNKRVFEPGDAITYTLRLINSGVLSTTVRYTITLPSAVVTSTGALSGMIVVYAGATVTPTVVVAQVRSDLAAGTTFQANVNLNDNYHPVFSLNFPQAVIHGFNTYLPLMMNDYAGPVIIIDHTTTGLSKIPPYWINQAKALLRLSYGHTSHGSQLVSGMSVFTNSLYAYNTEGSIAAGVLSLADYTPDGDLHHLGRRDAHLSQW